MKIRLAALAISFAVLAQGALAQCPPQVLPGLSPGAFDYLGSTTAMDGDLLLIGAPVYQPLAPRPGYVEVLRRENGAWVYEARLVAPGQFDVIGNEFGAAIELQGTRALIGAPGINGDAGGAFVINRLSPGNWVFALPWLTVGAVAGERLGSSVSFDGQYVALGAPRSNVGASSAGKVVIYDMLSPIIPAAQVFNPAPQTSAQFGSSVRLASQRLFVGAPFQGTSGAVFAYVGGPLNWPLEDTVYNPSSTYGGFGGGLFWFPKTQGGDLWIAAPSEQVNGLLNAGAIHRFGYQPPFFPQNGTFYEIEALTSDTPLAGGLFGTGLAVDQPSFGNWRVTSGSGNIDGHGYLFERKTFPLNVPWAITRKFQHPEVETTMTSSGLAGDQAVFGTREAGYGASLTGGAVAIDLSCQSLCGPRLPMLAPNSGDSIGQSIAVRRDFAAVGAPLDDTVGADAGAVHLFRYDGKCWYLETTLYDQSPAPGDHFGHAVAIDPDGDHVLVGAPMADGLDTDEGEVAVFRRVSFNPGWIQLGTISNPVAYDQAYFGFSLDVESRTVIGAPGTSATAGHTHVYNAPDSGFSTLQITLPSFSSSGDWFGYDVACEGGYVYIGNPLEATAGLDAGEVSIHNYNPFIGGWMTFQRFAGPGVAGHRFGASIDIRDGLGVVGAPAATVAGQPGAGLAYLYNMSVTTFGSLAGVMNSSFVAADETFGASVAVSGTRVSIGAPAGGTSGTGTVHDFEVVGSAVVLSAVLSPNGLLPDGEFGRAVATNGTQTLVGAPGGVGAGGEAAPGSAWVLEGHQNERFEQTATGGATSGAWGPPIP